MKNYKYSTALLVITIVAFAGSYVCAQIGRIDSKATYPHMVFNMYSNELSHTQAVNLKKDFNVNHLTEFSIAATTTRIEITPSSDDKLHLQIQGQFQLQNDLPESILEINETQDKFTCKIVDQIENKVSIFQFQTADPSNLLQISVPQNIKVISVKTVSGDINLRLADLQSLELITVSGDNKIDLNSAKDVKVKSVSGDLVAKGDLAKSDIKTVSGDASLRLRSGGSDLLFNSTSGDLNLELGSALNAKLDFKTVSGDLIIQPKPENFNSDGMVINQNFGDGLGLLNLKTVSGDIQINQTTLL